MTQGKWDSELRSVTILDISDRKHVLRMYAISRSILQICRNLFLDLIGHDITLVL